MRRERQLAAGFACGVMVVALALPAEASTYNAALQFHSGSASNTRGARWSYRFKGTKVHDGKYALLPDVKPDTRWHDESNNPVTLNVWQNPSGYPFITAKEQPFTSVVTNYCCGTVVLPKGAIFMDPGTTGLSVLSFRAPVAGMVTVSYKFTDIDPYGGDGIRWYVDVNASTKVSGSLHSTDPTHLATTGTRSFPVTVNAGDRINFIVDNNADGFFDSTAVIARVTYP